MRPAQAVMADLASAGLSAEQLALVIELSAAVAVESRPIEDKAAQRRRAKDRAYQAQRRQNRQKSAESADPPPPNDIDILTPQEKPSPTKPSGLFPPKPKSQKCSLPADWEPEPLTLGSQAHQIVQRWQPGRLERELSKFRDHHTAAGSRFHCWQAAWRKWINNSPDFERISHHERSDRDPTTVAVERLLGSHAGTS